MGTVWTIFKKELLDTLRDRRTLVMSLALPMVLFPLILWGVAEFQFSQQEKAESKVLRVGLVREGNAERFAEMLREREDIALSDGIPADSARAFVRGDSLDAAFHFDPSFDRQVAAREAGRMTLIFAADGDMEVERQRLRALADSFRVELRDRRFAELDVSPSVIETVELNEANVATPRETIGRLVGGFLPYIFLIFCYLGALYPAVDLAAGEKERHTMETLLTSPASRFQIVLGKFGVITLAGVASALIAVLGLYAGLFLIDELPQELLSTVRSVLEPVTVLLVLTLLVPLTMFFAGLQLTLSLFAKSFKEAQSILTPLSFVVIVPAIVGLLPGIELTATTAFIPVLNVSLATKEIIAGTADPGLLFIVYASLILLAGLGLGLCSMYFRKESVIFRV